MSTRPVFLSCPAVARMLGVSRQAVCAWCREGRITPARWTGTRWEIGRNFLPPPHLLHRLGGGLNKPPGPEGRPLGARGYYPTGVKRPNRVLRNKLRRQAAK